jgi:glycerophosphoryl diester phosphodiesterase
MRLVLLTAALMCGFAMAPGVDGSGVRKLLVAHRGASAYAPEHTAAAYRLAVEQGADFVEQDLGVTKDGALVCLHDPTLERTTDVEQVFPDRFREEGNTRRWYIADFTLAEIKRLDAGSWFDARFAGERVPSFEEAVAIVRGKAGIFPELKAPALYRDQDVDMAQIVAASLSRLGLERKGAVEATPVILQSFDAPALEAMARLTPSLDRTFLVDERGALTWLGHDGLGRVAAFATGIGPSKILIDRDPTLVARAKALRLSVIPYTFRSSAPGRFPSVRDEMAHFLNVLGVDGVFTDNPDQFPR